MDNQYHDFNRQIATLKIVKKERFDRETADQLEDKLRETPYVNLLCDLLFALIIYGKADDFDRSKSEIEELSKKHEGFPQVYLLLIDFFAAKFKENDSNKAVLLGNETKDLYEKLKKEDYVLAIYIYGWLGHEYDNRYDNLSAYKYYSVAISQKVDDYYNFIRIIPLNRFSTIQAALQNYDEAVELCKEGLEIAKSFSTEST